MTDWLNVSATTPRISYTATAAQVAFTVPFVFFADADLLVYQNAVLKTLAVHYTVTGAEVEAGGTVTLLTGATAGDIITIVRDVAIEQTTHIPPSGPLDVAAMNFQTSKLIAIDQQLDNKIDRTLHFPDSDPTASGELASQASRANKVLAFDSTGAVIYATGPTFVGSTFVGVAVVDTRSTAAATVFAISVNVVRTEGLTASGDGGGAVYIRGLVGDPGAFQDGGGVYWKPVTYVDTADIVSNAASRLLGRGTVASGIEEISLGAGLAMAGSVLTVSNAIPQGILTPVLSTTAPVPAADFSGATRLYWTPWKGSGCPIYNGVSLVNVSSGQLTLDLTAGAQVLNGIYDVYKFLNGGAATLGFSPSWLAGTSGSVTAGSCARGSGAGGTALTWINGVPTNAVAMTVNNGAATFSVPISQGTLLGSVWISTTAGQYSCLQSVGQSRVWGLSNAFNANPVTLVAQDPNSSWTSAPLTWRQSRADATNFAMGFQCLATERVNISFVQAILQVYNATTSTAFIGIGINSTTAASGKQGCAGIGTTTAVLGSGFMDAKAMHVLPPFLGISKINMLEQATSGTTNNSFQGSTNMLLIASWMA